jgi:ABC-type multidrug transport system ATPase subunit
MDEPNVLLLDEPTNDLDIETLTSLEDVLDGWAGTLLVVSHDRYLLERVCDRQVALLGDGRVRDLPGGVAEYLTLRAAMPPTTGYAVPPAASSAAASAGASGAGSGDAGPTQIQQREARKEMARIERALTRLAEREDRVHAQMAKEATDHLAVLRLNGDLRAIVDERDDLEMAWLAAAEIVG